VNFGRSRVQIAWDSSQTSLSGIARRIDGLGYALRPAKGRASHDVRRAEHRKMLLRVGVAGAIAGNVMLASVALYAGAFSGMDPAFEALFRSVSMGLALLSLAWPGATFFRGAIGAIRMRVPHTDVPIALGLTIGAGAGVYNTILGRGDIYADSLVMLVFLLLVGRWIQMAQQRWASDAVELFHSIAPSTARIIRAG